MTHLTHPAKYILTQPLYEVEQVQLSVAWHPDRQSQFDFERFNQKCKSFIFFMI